MKIREIMHKVGELLEKIEVERELDGREKEKKEVPKGELAS